MYGRTHVIRSPTPGGRGSPPLRCGGCGWPACPTAPTPPTVLPPPSTAQRIQSRGHSPRTIFEARGNRQRYVVCYNVRFAPTVGGGVLDAPRSRDCRGGLYAPAQPAQPHPRHPRCAHLASTTQRIQSRGHSPRTISYGRPTLSVDPRREGVEARPYDGWRGIRISPTLHQPLSHGASRRDSSPFRGAE